MALLDDIGANDPSPPTSTGSLLSDIGYKEPTPKASAHPVTAEFGDVIGNTAKHLAVGVGKLADLPGQIWDLAFHPEGEEPADIGTQVAKKTVGAPKNETALGRVVGAGIESAPAAILGGPEALLPTMASGVASQTAAEAGAGPVGQFVAGLTPFAPSALAGATRKLIRGGAEGAANMQENIQNANQAGLKLSAGQLSDNSALRGAETAGSHMPFSGPLDTTRGVGLNKQIEESVANITKKLSPNTVQNPPTPTTAGEIIQPALKDRVKALKQETSDVTNAMYEAGGGKDAPASAPNLQAVIPKVTNPTGVPEVDNLVTKAKTKAVEKTVNQVSQKPQIPISYSTDGNGFHVVSSPNGESHIREMANGDFQVYRSDTAPEAQGNGEGTARLNATAHIAAARGGKLISDVSLSPNQVKSFQSLANRGWIVTKNPNAEISPTGNTISDSPKNPIFTVTAPKTSEVPGSGQIAVDNEKNFTGEWTYDPTTGKTEPVTTPKVTLTPNTQKAELNPETPWTLGSLKQLRTDIGQNIGRTNGEAKRQLQTIYGAVSDDLRAHMASKGPGAEQAWDLFNHVASQNSATQKTLVRAVKELGGPEAAFKAAITGSKDGATKLEPVMGSLDDEGKNLFRATVLHRLGRAGGAADAPFDANKFLDNWKAMSPEAKNVLFGEGSKAGPPTQLRQSLDSLSNTMDLLKKQGYIKSGFVKGIEQGTSGYKKLGILGVLVLLKEIGGEAAMHAVEGHPFLAAGAATGAVGAMAGNPIMSRVLTNPKTATWLAQATKAPKGMVPVLLNQLNQMGNKDPDAKDLASLIAGAK